MKILVLGSSDTNGEAFARPDLAWPHLTAQAIRDSTGDEVTLVERKLYAWLPTAPDWAASVVAREQPDLVFVWMGTHAYAMSIVAERLRRKVGDRAAGFAERFEQRIRPGLVHGGLRGKVYLGAKLGARAVIGADRYCSPEEAAKGYGGAIRAAAQTECDVVALLSARNYYEPGRDALHARFARAMRPAIEQYRPLHVETDPLLGSGRKRRQLFMSNGMHKTPEGHRHIADGIIRAMRSAGMVFEPEAGSSPTG